MNFEKAMNAFIRILNLNITLEGYTFSLGTVVLFILLLGLLCFLIGGLLR